MRNSTPGKITAMSLLLTLVLFQSGVSQIDGQMTENLARQSEVIVVATVTGLKSEWNVDKSRIMTKATLTIEEQVKGDGGAREIIIQTLGGEVDGVGEVYSHVPRFRLNEEVIVFAKQGAGGVLEVVGGTDGKMSVIADEKTGHRLVADNESLQIFVSQLKRVVQKQSQE